MIVGAAAAAATVLALAGCATPTPYQPIIAARPTLGGFSETRLAADHYRVTFNGNGLTKRDTVERYMLYRAAELTLAQGYDWFEVDDRHTDRDRATYVDPDPFAFGPRYGPGFGAFGPRYGPGFGAFGPLYGPGFGFFRPNWSYYSRGYGWRSPLFGDPFWNNRFDISTVEKFEAGAEITLHKGPVPTSTSRAFDARQVKANLEPLIVRPVPKS